MIHFGFQSSQTYTQSHYPTIRQISILAQITQTTFPLWFHFARNSTILNALTLISILGSNRCIFLYSVPHALKTHLLCDFPPPCPPFSHIQSTSQLPPNHTQITSHPVQQPSFWHQSVSPSPFAEYVIPELRPSPTASITRLPCIPPSLGQPPLLATRTPHSPPIPTNEEPPDSRRATPLPSSSLRTNPLRTADHPSCKPSSTHPPQPSDQAYHQTASPPHPRPSIPPS